MLRPDQRGDDEAPARPPPFLRSIHFIQMDLRKDPWLSFVEQLLAGAREPGKGGEAPANSISRIAIIGCLIGRRLSSLLSRASLSTAEDGHPNPRSIVVQACELSLDDQLLVKANIERASFTLGALNGDAEAQQPLSLLSLYANRQCLLDPIRKHYWKHFDE